MVDFRLSDDTKALRELAHDFAEREMRPVAAEYDRDGTWPDDVLRKAWEVGLMNIHTPEEYGGVALSSFDGVVVQEELAWGCSGIQTSLGANGLAATPILIAGSDEIKREYLSMIFYSPQVRDAVIAKFDPASYHQSVNKSIWNDLQRFDLNPELPKFKFPTLVVTGRYDFNVAPSVAWAIHRAIPGSEFAVFEKSGHMPQCEESAGFAARLETFLSKR